MGRDRTPDQIAGEQTVSVGLHVALVGREQEGIPGFVLVEGSRDALRFLADIIRSVADSDSLPSDFTMSPSSAGRFHFADTATAGLYINCVESPSTDGVGDLEEQSDG